MVVAVHRWSGKTNDFEGWKVVTTTKRVEKEF